MKLLLAFALFALPIHASASLNGAPYLPEEDARFDSIETLMDASIEGNYTRYSAKAIYDVAVDGGSSVVHDLGVTIPAGAVITGLYVYINTAFTDSGTGSLRLSCSGSGDLIDWNDFTRFSASAVLASGGAKQSSGGGAVMQQSAQSQAGYNSLASACSVKAEVRSDSGYVPLTAGKATFVIDYFLK
jgi:hypothetical protein